MLKKSFTCGLTVWCSVGCCEWFSFLCALPPRTLPPAPLLCWPTSAKQGGCLSLLRLKRAIRPEAMSHHASSCFTICLILHSMCLIDSVLCLRWSFFWTQSLQSRQPPLLANLLHFKNWCTGTKKANCAQDIFLSRIKFVILHASIADGRRSSYARLLPKGRKKRHEPQQWGYGMSLSAGWRCDFRGYNFSVGYYSRCSETCR